MLIASWQWMQSQCCSTAWQLSTRHKTRLCMHVPSSSWPRQHSSCCHCHLPPLPQASCLIWEVICSSTVELKITIREKDKAIKSRFLCTKLLVRKGSQGLSKRVYGQEMLLTRYCIVQAFTLNRYRNTIYCFAPDDVIEPRRDCIAIAIKHNECAPDPQSTAPLPK